MQTENFECFIETENVECSIERGNHAQLLLVVCDSLGKFMFMRNTTKY